MQLTPTTDILCSFKMGKHLRNCKILHNPCVFVRQFALKISHNFFFLHPVRSPVSKAWFSQRMQAHEKEKFCSLCLCLHQGCFHLEMKAVMPVLVLALLVKTRFNGAFSTNPKLGFQETINNVIYCHVSNQFMRWKHFKSYTVEPQFSIWHGDSKIILLNWDIIVHKLPT